MTAMYKDAKDWLEQNATEGGISTDQLVSFILNEVSNDDIERWFGVNMEDDCDNPGAGMVYCSECTCEVDETDYNFDLDMCNDCAREMDEDEEETEDEEWTERPALTGWVLHTSLELFGDDESTVRVFREEKTHKLLTLWAADFDYFWRGDSNNYDAEATKWTA